MAFGVEKDQSADNDDKARPEEVVEHIHLGIELFQNGVVEGFRVVVAEERGVPVCRYLGGELLHRSGVFRSGLMTNAERTLERNTRRNYHRHQRK